MRILVASTAFPDVAVLLRERLPDDEIVVDSRTASGRFDVVVPLMTRIDAALLDRVGPRLIQQFGVGLEGVDRAAARARGIPVANVPAAGTGNADGVGEIAVLHLLALARRYHAGREAVRDGRLGEPLGSALAGSRMSDGRWPPGSPASAPSWWGSEPVPVRRRRRSPTSSDSPPTCRSIA
jgi:lactate dehydrogenase-like 2-hydroxyacid dehydrogenase